ncbi:MAG: hypothetical protein MUO95_00405 [Methanoregula sp.]|nr:hypothetical protein [Methanoregula sp.]
MDRIIKISLGLFTVIFVVFISVVSYHAFVEKAYLTSLSSTYSYTCIITTDSRLSNVTLFLPVPANPSGNSPIVAQFSVKNITGLPEDWTVTLYDTGKATMVGITTPEIAPPVGTTPEKPYVIRLLSEMKSDTVIDTREPIKNSAMFHPVRDLQQVSCPYRSSGDQGTPQCYLYFTSLYADYQAQKNASVNITSILGGKNSWKIFEPVANGYTTSVSLHMVGNNHGWSTMNGTLTSSIGSYDAPILRT